MPIPESQLAIWAKQGAISGSSATYATVKLALEAPTAKYASKNYAVFLQGSYGNDTNIYAESDVDVVIRLDSIYYYDTTALTPQDLAIFEANSSPGTYAYTDFKADVTAALQNSFGVASVKPGSRAINILPNANRRSADVIVATDFHRYHSATGILDGLVGPQYESGICFFTSDWQRIVNYPKQHSANCTVKHQNTNGWFKPMVRIFKNMRSKLVESGAIRPGTAPSYFIEGLLFNVPNDKFGTSYGDTFVAAMNWLLQVQQNTLTCANKQDPLVMDSVPTCWPCGDCTKFLNELAYWSLSVENVGCSDILSRMKPYITLTGALNNIGVILVLNVSLAAGPQSAGTANSKATPNAAVINNSTTLFKDNGNGTVTDKKTGLMWQKDDDGHERKQAISGSYCAALSLGGHSGWRLPGMEDLVSLWNNAGSKPDVRNTFFPSMKKSFYWSSTKGMTFPGGLETSFWGVNFYGEGVRGQGASGNTGYVRCVRLENVSKGASSK